MYMRTNEEAEAAGAINMASRFSEELETDFKPWRWLVIALHNAVQGFMVLSLRHGNGLLALDDESFAKWMEAHEKSGPYPRNEKLDSYLNLYKKVKSESLGRMGGNKNFVPSGTQGKSIKKLNEIRNEFIHFTPKGWSLEVNGLPRICLDCLALIRFLGWETENIFWHEIEHKEQAQFCCEKLQVQLSEIDRVYKKFSS